jgi:hypothetical protein
MDISFAHLEKKFPSLQQAVGIHPGTHSAEIKNPRSTLPGE